MIITVYRYDNTDRIAVVDEAVGAGILASLEGKPNITFDSTTNPGLEEDLRINISVYQLSALLVLTKKSVPVVINAPAPPNPNVFGGHLLVTDPHPGYATDADLSVHAAAADPHGNYVLVLAHGGVSPAGHHSSANDHAPTLDHARQHSVTSAPDHTFPGGTTFLRADGTFAAPSGGGGIWTTIIKPDDTARVNNTIADDPHLVVTLLANTNYTIKIRVWMTTNATADARMQLVFTGTTTRVARRVIRTATADIPAFQTRLAAFDAAPVVLSTTGVAPYYEDYLVLRVGASGGALAFRWAQVTTNAGACTVLEGSHIEYAVT